MARQRRRVNGRPHGIATVTCLRVERAIAVERCVKRTNQFARSEMLDKIDFFSLPSCLRGPIVDKQRRQAAAWAEDEIGLK